MRNRGVQLTLRAHIGGGVANEGEQSGFRKTYKVERAQRDTKANRSCNIPACAEDDLKSNIQVRTSRIHRSLGGGTNEVGAGGQKIKPKFLGI